MHSAALWLGMLHHLLRHYCLHLPCHGASSSCQCMTTTIGLMMRTPSAGLSGLVIIAVLMQRKIKVRVLCAYHAIQFILHLFRI